jgi:phosphoglycolate phosphatase
MPASAPPDALVFDLDGTLWDTNAICAQSWNCVVARLGIAYRPITTEDVRSVAGKAHLDAVREVFAGLAEDVIERISLQTQTEDNLAIARHGADIYPGVRELVPRLRACLPLMIVSNCQRGYIELFLSTSGLGEHFVDFECWGNTGNHKAANLRALIARNHLLSPWLVGDTEGDHQAASENRMPFVHAAYGFGAVSGCDARIQSFAELAELTARTIPVCRASRHPRS